MKKIQIALLAGGPSAEHEVSLKSAEQILQTLDKEKYSVTPVFISKQNTWAIGQDSFPNEGKLELLDGLKQLQRMQPDIVFLGLHGTFGEDGKIQAILESLQLRFTGSGSFASALAMDKVVSQDLMQAHGLTTIPTVDFWQMDWQQRKDEILKLCMTLGKPIFLKPVDNGSSVGACKNITLDQLEQDIEKTFEHSQHIMVQPCIVGQEFSCGVVEDQGKLKALVPTEIIPNASDFFDYEAKYIPGASSEVTPANIAPELSVQIQEAAAKAHILHNCRGYSRTDFLYDGKKLYTLEINTLPGMTQTSLLPQQAKAAGIAFPDLLDLIVESGLA